MAERSTLFEHYPVTREIIDVFNDRMDNAAPTWRARKKRGEYLAWRNGVFTIRGKKETRTFVAWHDKDGNPIDVSYNKLPACTVVAPAGPIKSAFLTGSDALRYAEDVARAEQKIVLDHETTDSALYADFIAFVEDLRKLLVDSRATHLATTLDSHEHLSAGERKMHKKSGPDALAEKIKEGIEDSFNRSHHECRFWSPKHKLLRQRYSDGPMQKVCEADKELLPSMDVGGKIETFLENSDAFYSLNPLRINLARPGETVAPDEYNLIRPGGVASMEICIYGMHMRVDGQHSVMTSLNSVALLTNGPQTRQEMTGVDMFDMLHAAKKAKVESGAVES